MAAARHWAVGGMDPERRAALTDAQDLLASLREWNAGPEHTGPVENEIARLGAEADCPVHADTWDAVMLFTELSTQWRVIPTFGGAVYAGLDYPAVCAVLQMRGWSPERQRAMFADLQVMEVAALAAWREQREAQAAKKKAAH